MHRPSDAAAIDPAGTGYVAVYAAQGPTRAQVDALPGRTLLEFGTPWCGYCRAAQSSIAAALAAQPQLRHLKVEDGSGRPLGRSFGVKLWPTLVLLQDGVEVTRLVRPLQHEVAEALAAGSAPASKPNAAKSFGPTP